MSESEKLYEFKKLLRKLRAFQGSGTELISLYVAKGAPIHDSSAKLREELGQASNIKSKSTKTNVMGALERMIGYLKMFKSTPPNGLAVFCGNTSNNSAKIEMEVFSVEPPFELNVSAYRCDNKFFIQPLEDMIETKDAYGLVVMDGREATLAILRGKNTEILKKLVSMAHAKVSKGGQSQRRYQRLVEESIEYYHKRIGEYMDECFLGKVKGIIVGGPGPAKDSFMKLKPYNYQLKILGMVDTGYTDEYGIREVLSKSENLIAEQEAIREKQVIDNFIKEISKNGLALYGYEKVKEATMIRQAEKILLSEELQSTVYLYKCNSCNETLDVVSMQKEPERISCTKCKGELRVEKSVLVVDYIIDLARESSIDVEMISDKTAEGSQFLAGFTGIGAFLRYKK
ncbi:MAG: peptide chain release factor aRF-1 [Candidatus Micrarchaeota archaeon]